MLKLLNMIAVHGLQPQPLYYKGFITATFDIYKGRSYLIDEQSNLYGEYRKS